MIVCASASFGLGGILIGMEEELIAFAPLLVRVNDRLGYSRITAVAMSLGAAVVGGAFSPINPFLVVIAQRAADLPIFTGLLFRSFFLLAALAVWIAWTVCHAERTRARPHGTELQHVPVPNLTPRHLFILGLVPAAFVLFLIGHVRSGWSFNHMSGLFLAIGVLGGLIAGLGIDGTAEAFAKGFREMAPTALIIGFARHPRRT